MAVSFIICTYNRSNYLNDTVQSLRDCIFNESKIEFLIVDNNSTDDTAQVVKYHQENNKNEVLTISYIKEEQQGLSFARNKGIVESKFGQIVFVDDDIRASEEFIEGWNNFFKENPEVNAAGSRIHVQFDGHKPEWVSYFLMSLFGYHEFGKKPRRYPKKSYPFGGNMGFRKFIFESVGYFNTNLGRKGNNLAANEEKELFRRIRNQNHQVFYNPNALLYHRVNEKRATSDFIKKQAMGLGKSYKVEIIDGSISQVKVYMQQFIKLVITLVLAIFYVISFQPSKANMLIKFRIWIFKGLKLKQ